MIPLHVAQPGRGAPVQLVKASDTTLVSFARVAPSRATGREALDDDGSGPLQLDHNICMEVTVFKRQAS